jgi:hypothetical protein
MSRGGKRAGAGQPRKNTIKKQFKISTENVQFIDQLPIGDKSKFVDEAIGQAIKTINQFIK